MRYRDIIKETTNQSDDSELRRWFAGSKIIDDDNNPLIVHHFTHFDFSEFDRMFGARYFKRNPEGIDTIGSWFTTNPKARYAGAGGRRMDVYLRITRPFYIDDLEDGKNDSDAWSQLAKMVKGSGSTALRDDLKQRGYDGIILLGTFLDGFDQTVIVAFEADQIKVAASNPITQ